MNELNLLTKRLLESGYTKENPPDFVRPWNDYHGGFEYKIDYHRKLMFKTACGLLVNGSHWSSGTAYYMGITWCLENGNPLIRCPFNKKGCELNHPFLRGKEMFGYLIECVCSETSEEYDYEKSLDKVLDDKSKHEKQLFEEFKMKKKGRVCPEMCHFYETEGKWKQLYNPIDICSKRACRYCVVLDKELTKTKGNVFYDVKETRADTSESLFNVGDIKTVRKGIRFLDENCSLDICEMIVRNFKKDIIRKFEMRHHSELYFSKFHGLKYEFEILNIRAEKRVSRNLEQDLADIREGIEVIHDSDMKAAAIQAKRERKQKATASKIRKLRKKMSEIGFNHLEIQDRARIEKMIRHGLMDVDEIIFEPEPKEEQLSLFESEAETE